MSGRSSSRASSARALARTPSSELRKPQDRTLTPQQNIHPLAKGPADGGGGEQEIGKDMPPMLAPAAMAEPGTIGGHQLAGRVKLGHPTLSQDPSCHQGHPKAESALGSKSRVGTVHPPYPIHCESHKSSHVGFNTNSNPPQSPKTPTIWDPHENPASPQEPRQFLKSHL